eukprot:CAMPEP_0117671468 /NCGR_PEP_ID=MMETSP0804-20121206/13350_1 /TAXON_ID=1074897 /ORGANISM="Tetraselmis astigmatica, Strain CCMP880" /LENGTH=598 /DNA_ID=CAMNT_0005479931 /DNA_START=89 /DNA_END=1885 /DNA_ORIENTATION=+
MEMPQVESTATVAPAHHGLLHLPDELLTRVIRGAGCKAAASAGCACRQLRAVRSTLLEEPAFSSAMELGTEFEDALKAAGGAADAMPAAVGFAVVFTCGYRSTRRSGTQPSALSGHLQGILPPGVPVVGCSGHGLVGVRADGLPYETDPDDDAATHGVSVLLGYIPGTTAHVFSSQRPTRPLNPSNMRAWMSLPSSAADSASLLLLFLQGSVANLLSPGPDPHNAMLKHLHLALPQASIMGGIHATNGQLYGLPRLDAGEREDLNEKPDFVGMVLHQASPSSCGSTSTRSEVPAWPSRLARARSLSILGVEPVPNSGTWSGWMTVDDGTVHLGGLDIRGLWDEYVNSQLFGFAEWVCLYSKGSGGRDRQEPVALARIVGGFEEAGAGEMFVILDMNPDEAFDLVPALRVGPPEPDQAGPKQWFSCRLGQISPDAGRQAVILISQPRLVEHLGGELPGATAGSVSGVGEGSAAPGPCFRDPYAAAGPVTRFANGAASSRLLGGIKIGCVARGAGYYSVEPNLEATVLAKACRERGFQYLPLAGAFCEGEIGPFVSGGDYGVQDSGVTRGPAEAVNAVAPTSRLQAYTSIYTMLSAIRTS